MSDRLVQACTQYSWPGNVRELQNFAKRHLILENEEALLAELRGGSRSDTLNVLARVRGDDGDLKKMMRHLKGEAEAEAIARALEQTNWNRKAAAEQLNISYKALVYKSRQYGILPPKNSPSGQASRS